MALDFDSGEYEFLAEAVELSKDVDGMLVEVGLRLGFGTKTIIDAACEHRPGSIVLSIDPFGSIPYIGREHVGPIRLDYDNPMYRQVLMDMSAYVFDKNVEWQLLKMTDEKFFEKHSDGIELYDLFPYTLNKYALVHLDGPHHFDAVSKEGKFFSERMDSGGCIILDDCTPDFIQIEPVNKCFDSIGLKLIKQGIKKNIYQKV